ncbi:hypothetical protein D3C75_1089370 [compost metagenome]
MQSRQPGFGLQAQGQQKTFIQGQACTNRIQALRCQPLQAFLALMHFLQRAENFPPRLQHPRPVVMGQRLE